MSRTGKKPVAPVSGVTVTINGRTVTAKGPKGELSIELMDVVNVEQTGRWSGRLRLPTTPGLLAPPGAPPAH